MSFKLDFNDTFEGFEKVEDGVYEVIIESVTEDATPSGAEYTQFTLVIRNDLDQPYKNQKVWHRNWKAKATGNYNMMMFNTIGKAAQLQNGKTYNSFDELLNDYEGKPVQVFVKNETSEYNGKTYENTNVKSWKPSAFPQIQHKFNSKDNAGGNPFNSSDNQIKDSDIPF